MGNKTCCSNPAWGVDFSLKQFAYFTVSVLIRGLDCGYGDGLELTGHVRDAQCKKPCMDPGPSGWNRERASSFAKVRDPVGTLRVKRLGLGPLRPGL